MPEKEYKTLRVPESAYVEARASKREAETWGDFIQRCSENPPEQREYVEGDVVREMVEEFEGLPTEDMHADQFAKEVANHLDYAEISHAVAKQVATELRQ